MLRAGEAGVSKHEGGPHRSPHHKRKQAGRSRARPVKFCFELPARKPLGFRQETFALRALASQFPRPADGFGLLARLALGGLLEMVAAFHLPEETLALHLLLERLQRLVDVVVADNDLNDLKLSIEFPEPASGLNAETPKRPDRIR